MSGREGRVRWNDPGRRRFCLKVKTVEVKTIAILPSVTMWTIRDQFPFSFAKHISNAHPGQVARAVLGTGDPAVKETDLVPAS